MPSPKQLTCLEAVERDLFNLADQYRLWRADLPPAGTGWTAETQQTVRVLAAVRDLLKATLPACDYIPF